MCSISSKLIPCVGTCTCFQFYAPVAVSSVIRHKNETVALEGRHAAALLLYEFSWDGEVLTKTLTWVAYKTKLHADEE